MGTKKWKNVLLILLSSLLILSLGISLFLSPVQVFSEAENRVLAGFPEWRVNSLLDGSFSQKFSKFCADQFPLRSFLVALSAYSDLAMGRGEHNGILFGDGGFLIPRGDENDLSVLSENLDSIASLSSHSQTPVSLFFVPRHADVLTDLLPDGAIGESTREVAKTLSSFPLPTLFPIERWQGRAEYYYKTDHHLSAKGAYAAYLLLSDALGFSPKEETYFEPLTVSDSFLGTSYSTAGGVSFSSDSVTLYRYEQDDRFLVCYEGSAEPSSGFYHWDALEKKDKYSIFLGGNYARLTVSDPTADPKPRLLLIKDSYANALIPFLAIHYDLTVLDPRYRLMGMTENLLDYDRVLILYGLDTLAKDPSLQRFLSSLS